MENGSNMEGLVSLADAFPEGAAEELVRRLGLEGANALASCAERGIVHQAVTPQNVFLAPDGSFRLGPALSGKAARMPCGGDMSCMCPEMYWGEGFDSRADVYALGLLLYTLLNDGCLPLTVSADDDKAVRAACLRRLEGEQLPPPKNGSAELCRVVLRACAYEPAQRYASAQEMKEALHG